MFAFVDNSSKTYTLNEIDVLAAEFWGTEVHPRFYASPKKDYPNWFDVLGHAIEDLQYFTHQGEKGKVYFKSEKASTPIFNMGEIAMQLLHNCVYTKNLKTYNEGLEFFKPYVELCFFLKEKGIFGEGHGW